MFAELVQPEAKKKLAALKEADASNRKSAKRKSPRSSLPRVEKDN